VNVAGFDYHLPPERIAQQPLEDRAGSRMLLVDRKTGRFEGRMFRDFPACLERGDRLVVNNARVLPARLFGRREGVHATTSKDQVTGLVEVMLVKRLADDPPRWEALVRPGRKIHVGESIHFPGGLQATVTGRGEFGLRVVEFNACENFYEALDRAGHVPLPPYIKRADESSDRQKYQTIYASQPGSVAAPTAGLHFTPEVLDEIDTKGVVRVEITLHVGLGTFQPVRTERVEEHKMHSERYEISAEAARQLASAGRVIAVGTTAVRTLEHAVRVGGGSIRPGCGETEIFITPGFEFRVVDALLTNFHLPRSTLLMLVCAFAGRDLVMEAYAHAIREGYRFYSYGDCMFVR
jgi:S-adenosylmethionine:tRNA ribosyltransferase-isomerase